MPNDLHKFKIYEVVNIKPESIFNEFMHEWNSNLCEKIKS